MYMTCRLSNPHFSPELYAQIQVVNFTVTMGGLEQQLLGRVVQKERHELEEQRKKLMDEVGLRSCAFAHATSCQLCISIVSTHPAIIPVLA